MGIKQAEGGTLPLRATKAIYVIMQEPRGLRVRGALGALVQGHVVLLAERNQGHVIVERRITARHPVREEACVECQLHKPVV